MAPLKARRLGMTAIFFLCSCALSWWALAPQRPPAQRRAATSHQHPALKSLPSRHAAFAVLGDTQRTIPFWETALLMREQNDEERKCLMHALGKAPVGFVAILGDMVARSDEDNWDYFLGLIRPLREARVPVLPLMGNHEYMGDEKLVQAHFPQLGESQWYEWTHEGLLLVCLNTNLSQLSADQRARQLSWYDWVVGHAEGRDDIKGILVMGHHPFYSNSSLTGDEPDVREEFGPVFFGAKKTMAYLSGHAHTYERLAKDGKLFVVTGGGGGPRVGLDKRHLDLVQGAAPRPFHYLVMTPDGVGLQVQAMGMDKGECQVRTLEGWTLPWPKLN